MPADMNLAQTHRWQTITRYWKAVEQLLGTFDRLEKLDVQFGTRGTWEQPADPPDWDLDQRRALADLGERAVRVRETHQAWLEYLAANPGDPWRPAADEDGCE